MYKSHTEIHRELWQVMCGYANSFLVLGELWLSLRCDPGRWNLIGASHTITCMTGVNSWDLNDGQQVMIFPLDQK